MNEESGPELDQPAIADEGQEEDVDTSLSLFDKKLRFTDRDLEITVCNSECEKTFYHYSIMMASFYGFFDSLLSSGMRESLSKKVKLEDVDPEVFELATSLLDNQLRLKKATVADFLKVACFYHRYDSKPGLDLIEEYLGDFLDSWTKNEERHNPTPHEMDMIIAAILFSKDAQIQSLITKGKNFVEFLLAENKLFSQSSFQETHIKDIKPFLVAYPECLEAFLQKYCRHGAAPDYNSEHFAAWLHAKYVAVRNFYRLNQLPPVKWEVYVEWVDHNQSRSKQAICSGLRQIAPSRDHLESYYTIGSFAHLNVDDIFHFAKATIAQYCMIPAGLQVRVGGTVGFDFHYTDWILFIQLLGGGASMSFAFPFSGSMTLPPVGYGWKQLSGADRCAARVRLEYKII